MKAPSKEQLLADVLSPATWKEIAAQILVSFASSLAAMVCRLAVSFGSLRKKNSGG